MTPRQIAALQRVTRNINEYNLDGRVSFRVEPSVRGEVLLCASNAYSDLRWFERSICVLITVGPMGGIKVRHCEGFHRPLIK